MWLDFYCYIVYVPCTSSYRFMYLDLCSHVPPIYGSSISSCSHLGCRQWGVCWGICTCNWILRSIFMWCCAKTLLVAYMNRVSIRDRIAYKGIHRTIGSGYSIPPPWPYCPLMRKLALKALLSIYISDSVWKAVHTKSTKVMYYTRWDWLLYCTVLLLVLPLLALWLLEWSKVEVEVWEWKYIWYHSTYDGCYEAARYIITVSVVAMGINTSIDRVTTGHSLVWIWLTNVPIYNCHGCLHCSKKLPTVPAVTHRSGPPGVHGWMQGNRSSCLP